MSESVFEKLLDKATKSYMKNVPTFVKTYKLSKIVESPDLLLVDADQPENYLPGMWDGIQGYKRELSFIDGCEEADND